MKKKICLWQQPALLLAGWCLFWEKPSGKYFLPTLFASFVTDVYAEILARICKHLRLFVTSIIPLIPGSTLYCV